MQKAVSRASGAETQAGFY